MTFRIVQPKRGTRRLLLEHEHVSQFLCELPQDFNLCLSWLVVLLTSSYDSIPRSSKFASNKYVGIIVQNIDNSTVRRDSIWYLLDTRYVHYRLSRLEQDNPRNHFFDFSNDINHNGQFPKIVIFSWVCRFPIRNKSEI